MLADLILLLHAAFVLFVVGGLVATWVGAAYGRPWARNTWFRGLHLAAVAFVVAESVLGYACPLTIWEDALRGAETDEASIALWVRALLYWSAPAWVFTAIYAAFGALVAATWWRIPPRRG
jgi:polyferredoxin